MQVNAVIGNFDALDTYPAFNMFASTLQRGVVQSSAKTFLLVFM